MVLRLATDSDLQGRLNSNVTNTVANQSVLSAATPIVESVLGTPLALSERIDWFDYIPSRMAGRFTTLRLLLTQGFIVDGTFSLYLSEDGTAVDDVFTGLTALVENEDYFLNQETGVIELEVQPTVGRSTIAAYYEAGFSGETDSTIPQWLNEAVISAAIGVLHTSKVAHKKEDITGRSRAMRSILCQQLNSHVRPRMIGAPPARTLVL